MYLTVFLFGVIAGGLFVYLSLDCEDEYDDSDYMGA